MILSEKDKLKYIERYKKGMSITEASKIYHVSKRTIRDFENRLREEGFVDYRRNLYYTVDDSQPIEIKTSPKRTLKLENFSDEEIEELKRSQYINWKIIKSKVKKEKRNLFKTYLVTADYHIPEHDTATVKSILKLCEDVAFDGFFIVGDFLDMTPISHWLHDQKRNKSLEGKRLLKDYIIGNALLDEFDKRLPEKCDKRFWYGNHERFYYDFIEKFPALENLFNPTIELHLKERNYTVYEKINHIERVGRLSITHGIYGGVNYLKKHLDDFATNVMIGHLHKLRIRTSSSPAKELATIGYSLPCLCNRNPSYMKNKPNEWVHGFGILYLYKTGFFDVDLKRIVKGKFIFNGKEYDGNK